MWISGKCVGFWFSVVLLGYMTKFQRIMFSLKFSVLVDGGFDRNRVQFLMDKFYGKYGFGENAFGCGFLSFGGVLW